MQLANKGETHHPLRRNARLSWVGALGVASGQQARREKGEREREREGSERVEREREREIEI
eukprot:2355630-Pyramimonas_sp.AAC.1